MNALELPDVDMPVPKRHIVKWSRWKAWTDDDGKSWLAYSCRYTEHPIPEWCADFTVSKKPFECRFSHYDLNRAGRYFSTRYITRGVMGPYEDRQKLIDAVRSGDLKVKLEGGPYPRL